MAAHHTPPSLGFSRQEHWSGLPFPSPMNESEKWTWSHSVVSYSLATPWTELDQLMQVGHQRQIMQKTPMGSWRGEAGCVGWWIGWYRGYIVEKAMAPHSSTLAWKIPWAEEPDRLQSMGSLKARHNWATSLSFFTFIHWRRKWQPTPLFLPGESQGQGSLVGCHLWGRTELDTTEAT